MTNDVLGLILVLAAIPFGFLYAVVLTCQDRLVALANRNRQPWLWIDKWLDQPRNW